MEQTKLFNMPEKNPQMINISASLTEKISSLTGIPESKLKATANKHGVQFIFHHPAALELTTKQAEKLQVLKSFISEFNETEFLNETTQLNSSSKAGEYFKARLSNVKDKEHFEVAFLNAQNEVIATKTMFKGTISEAPVYPRLIIQEALNHDANSVMLAHNHPGGNKQPSNADIEATRKIKAALETIQIRVMDHILVAGESFTSFAELGLL